MPLEQFHQPAPQFSYLRVPAPTGMSDCYENRPLRQPLIRHSRHSFRHYRARTRAPYAHTGRESRGGAPVQPMTRENPQSDSVRQPALLTQIYPRQPQLIVGESCSQDLQNRPEERALPQAPKAFLYPFEPFLIRHQVAQIQNDALAGQAFNVGDDGTLHQAPLLGLSG